MITPSCSDFPRLKHFLWRGTLTLQFVFLVTVLWVWPHLFRFAISGVIAGVFYLWSLIFSAEHPRHKVQFVFSLIRIVLLAYVIVNLAQARIPELAIVMCGLLSYKVILSAEYVTQALPALRWMSPSGEKSRKVPARKTQ